MGTTKPQKSFDRKIVFYGNPTQKKFADFNGTIIFEIRQKMAEISLKMWFRHRYTRENDPLKCHNSRENAARGIANWQIRQPCPPYTACDGLQQHSADDFDLKGIRAAAHTTDCGSRWVAVFTLVTCSTESYVVRMLKLLVAHFTAILVYCATTLAASTRPFLRSRYRFRKTILTKGVISLNSGSFTLIVTFWQVQRKTTFVEQW